MIISQGYPDGYQKKQNLRVKKKMLCWISWLKAAIGITIKQIIAYDRKKNEKANGSRYNLQVKTCRRSKRKPKVSMKYQLPMELKIVTVLQKSHW